MTNQPATSLSSALMASTFVAQDSSPCRSGVQNTVDSAPGIGQARILHPGIVFSLFMTEPSHEEHAE
jgi:hypothetical protein